MFTIPDQNPPPFAATHIGNSIFCTWAARNSNGRDVVRTNLHVYRDFNGDLVVDSDQKKVIQAP